MTSPDGSQVAAITQDYTLLLSPLQGGEPRTVTKLSADETVNQWSADGRTLFVSCPGTRLEVSGIDLPSGARRLWKTFQPPDPAGVRASVFLATPDARGYAYSYMRILDELYCVEGLK
ncbi:MAG: hypothetical protein JXA73_04880 [Acidobacteria bacterium]|nr:hypothetical protein [Acidobacteriota bacterium]